MTNIPEVQSEQSPKARWIGEIYGIGADEFTCVIRDDYIKPSDERAAIILFSNAAETDRPKIARGVLFYCDIDFLEGSKPGTIRGVEFLDDNQSDQLHAEAFSILGRTMRAAEERDFPA